MTANLTNFTNVTAADSFFDLAQASNQISGGWLANIMIVLLFIIVATALARWGKKAAIGGASFLTLLVTIALMFAGIVTATWMLYSAIIMVMATLGVLFFSGGD